MPRATLKQDDERAALRAPEVGAQALGPYEFSPNETYREEVFSSKWHDLRSEEYREYRTAWDSVPRSKIELPFPIHLDIETTNICNLLCPMCPRTVLLENGSFSELGTMTRTDYRSIIDQGIADGLKSIKLNYLGEPMAHKDVAWQVEYAKNEGVLDVMMNSNGTLLTKKRGEALLNAGLDNLFISFDAVNPQDYEIQRRGTTIGKVIDNVFEFVKLRDKINPACQIRISMVMYDEPKWLEQFEALKVMWRGLVDAVGYGFYTDRSFDKQGEYPEVPGFHCAQPFQRMFLKYNGNVTMCCVDDKDEVVFGDWRKQPLQEIWQSEKYRHVRALHATGQYYKLDICRRCYLPVSA